MQRHPKIRESLLHQVWKEKSIPIEQLVLTDNREITIIDFGVFNEELKGPDFKFGGVLIDDIKLFGHIEMHLNASDWYKHGHHNDDNYKNVILHVVLNNDQPVTIDGVPIPTIVLDQSLILKKSWFNKRTEILCGGQFDSSLNNELDEMKKKSIQKKWYKSNLLFVGKRSDEVLFGLMAKAFGGEVNKDGFLELISKIELNSFNELSRKKKEQLIIIESEVLTSDSSLSIWNNKGTRPASFPKRRVRQFASIASNFNFNWQFDTTKSPEAIHLEFKNAIRFASKELPPDKKLSTRFLDHLSINVLANWINSLGYYEVSIEILRLIKPENNKIIRKWDRDNYKIRNSFDSQGILALYRSYCSRKKCLSCTVGTKLLYG